MYIYLFEVILLVNLRYCILFIKIVNVRIKFGKYWVALLKCVTNGALVNTINGQ